MFVCVKRKWSSSRRPFPKVCFLLFEEFLFRCLCFLHAKVETIYTYAESKEEEAKRIAAEKEAARKEQERLEAEKKKEEAANKKYKAPTGKTAKDVVEYAKQFIGNPYVWGGERLTKGV